MRTRSCNLIVFLLVCGSQIAAGKPGTHVLYVSLDGNDRWSGTYPIPSRDGIDGPFATPGRALLAVREMRDEYGGRLREPVNIVLRGGTYFLDEPLRVMPRHSGTDGIPVTFSAYEAERPVISAGRRITGWKRVTVGANRLWAAEIPGVRDSHWDFHELWVDGKRRTRARHPNHGTLRIAGIPDLVTGAPYSQGQSRFVYHGEDIRPWRNLNDVEVVVMHFWVAARLSIASIDVEDRIVNFQKGTRRRMTEGFRLDRPAPYYVENALEFLDSPGEWYLDRTTGTLYAMGFQGEDLREAEVIAPALTQVMRLEGRPEERQYVQHINFRDITFAHSEFQLPSDEPGDLQAATFVPGAVWGEGVRECTFERCRIEHVGSYGLELARGCQNNRITACEVSDLAAGGIRIGETAIRAAKAEQSFGNEIVDCRIHDGGWRFHQAIGVWIGQSYRNRLAFCDIHDFLYTGISVGWTWGYKETLARENTIENNHVHHIGMRSNGEGRLLSDMGGIYTLGMQPGTVIRNNLFHDIAGREYGGWGIYFDEGSTHIVAEKNIVYRASNGGFHQHYGRENTVRNNIFAFGKKSQINRTRREDHLSFTFEKNIVFWDEGSLLWGNWTDNFRCDRNVYWKAGGGPFRFGKLTWEEWREKGNDPSSVIADPRFAKPEEFDFTLAEDSPALELGIEPIQAEHYGPR